MELAWPARGRIDNHDHDACDNKNRENTLTGGWGHVHQAHLCTSTISWDGGGAVPLFSLASGARSRRSLSATSWVIVPHNVTSRRIQRPVVLAIAGLMGVRVSLIAFGAWRLTLSQTVSGPD